MKIIQQLLPSEKYSIKAPFPLKVEYIVVHNTGNDASARNEIAYMIRNDSQTGFHYAIDDQEIVQGIPDDRNAWHAGDGNGNGNRSGLGIEICYSKSGGAKFDEAEKLAARFIAMKLREYNLGIDRVIRHYDCSGKNCPHRTMRIGWVRFLKMIEEELEEEMVAKEKMIVNGKEVVVEVIKKNNQNFIKLADLRDQGLDVRYDQGSKKVGINFRG